jgi:hypothetical protein
MAWVPFEDDDKDCMLTDYSQSLWRSSDESGIRQYLDTRGAHQLNNKEYSSELMLN